MATDTTSEAGTAEPKLSAVEGIKENSHFLRGTLPEQLAEDTDHFTEEGKQLIKFHGSYQQEDRDARKNRPKGGAAGKAYCFMIRLKCPGGKLTADQYLAMDDICERYGNSTLRLTNRQSIQFHGVLKSNLKATIGGINDALVSTLGACGDVNRNVLSCPAPTGDPVRVQMQTLADAVARHLAPRAGGKNYHDLWVNGEKVGTPEPYDDEPIYGKVYLPRKFKVAFALPHDNCTDALANCLGFMAVIENGRPIGYNVYVGGSQGRTSGKPETFPHLGRAMVFVEPDRVVETAEAVVKLFRDHGNRVDRRRARLKYVVYDWGTEKFRDVLIRDYIQRATELPRENPITGVDLHHGWHTQVDGKWFLGLSVENGRIKDEGTMRLRSGLRAIVSKFRPIVRNSAQQDILLGDIDGANKAAIEAMMAEYGIPKPETLSMVQKWSMACPAIPTCPLAITESERVMPGFIDQIEPVLEELGLKDELISIRMTGCPNGCGRPYQSEIGLVGRGGTKVSLFVGGDSFGRRLNTMLQDSVPFEQVIPMLTPVLKAFQAERTPAESFGDFCHRIGLDRVRQLATIE